MTPDEYFDAHLPHRVNLLTTFRNRYSGRRRLADHRLEQPWDEPRDFFRCSKDISILMVRFFCDEMGLHLPENATEPKDKKERHGEPWQPRFKCKRFTIADAKKDPPRFHSLVAVLKAANRAVAHINELDVDHGFKSKPDHEALFDVIDWIENLIQTHMYEPNNGRSLSVAMQLPHNVVAPSH
jgi:hypothetical protein